MSKGAIQQERDSAGHTLYILSNSSSLLAPPNYLGWPGGLRLPLDAGWTPRPEDLFSKRMYDDFNPHCIALSGDVF